MKKIILLRYLHGLSHTDMGKKLHLSSNAYGKVERGETQLTTERLKQIADIFQVNPTLLSDDTACVTLKPTDQGSWILELNAYTDRSGHSYAAIEEQLALLTKVCMETNRKILARSAKNKPLNKVEAKQKTGTALKQHSLGNRSGSWISKKV